MRSDFIEVNDFKIHYLEGGEGKPIIILPSFWITSRTYQYFGEELSKNYRVFIPDLGRGKSAGRKLLTSLTDYVSLLNSFIDKMKIDKFCLIGISFGGMIATEYYKKYPQKIESLFLTSTITTPTGGSFFWGAKAYLQMFYNNLFFENGFKTDLLWLFDGIFNFFIKQPRQFLKDIPIAIKNFNQEEGIKELKIPHLLVLAKKDEFISLGAIKKMQENKGLNTEIIEGTHPWFLLRPKEFLAKVETFLKEN